MNTITMNQGCANNPSFSSLKIKVKGKYFKENPDEEKKIIEYIKKNKGLAEFFQKRHGKIEVKSSEVITAAYYRYPSCLQRPLEPKGFYLDELVPKMEINGTYKRAFAIRNLFRKPVWFEAHCGGVQGSTWERCMNATLKFLDNFGEKNSANGKDLFSIETRRLKVEKP